MEVRAQSYGSVETQGGFNEMVQERFQFPRWFFLSPLCKVDSSNGTVVLLRFLVLASKLEGNRPCSKREGQNHFLPALLSPFGVRVYHLVCDRYAIMPFHFAA